MQTWKIGSKKSQMIQGLSKVDYRLEIIGLHPLLKRGCHWEQQIAQKTKKNQQNKGNKYLLHIHVD